MYAQPETSSVLKSPTIANAIPTAIARLERTIQDTSERLMALSSSISAILGPSMDKPEQQPNKRDPSPVPLAEVIHALASSAADNLRHVEELLSRVQL